MIDVFEGWNEELQVALYDGIDEDIGIIDAAITRVEAGEDPTDDEVATLLSVLPQYSALSSLQAMISTGFQWQAQNNLTGAVYQPISNSGNILKKYAMGTSSLNNQSGGADQVFSFQQGVPAGSSATVDLTAMTNLLGQASQSIARFKSYQTRLLSAADDATISPAPNAASIGLVTNMGNVANVSALDFGLGGSGLTLNTVVAAGALNTVSIMLAGSSYPPSTTLLVAPSVAGGSGGSVAVTTNAAGIPTGVPVVVSAGAGYSNTSNLPTTPLGGYQLNTGDAHASVNITNTGVAVSNISKNIRLVNLDATHAVTFELDFPAAST